MSVVTGVMLILGPADWPDEDGDEGGLALRDVQAWLADRNFGPLVDVSEQSGGNKHPQFEAWSAGFNYFPESEFIAFVKALPWEGPEHFVLIVQPEEGAVFVHAPGAVPWTGGRIGNDLSGGKAEGE